MLVSRALNPRRIARSLVTVLVLTLIETVVAPVVAPILSTPKAEAVDVAYASYTAGTDVVVPAGATSVTLTARGGAGGTGGNDASAGLAGSNVGYVTGTFAVSPGDRITMFPGGAGGNGLSGVSNTGAGSGGPASIPNASMSLTPSIKFNGTYNTNAFLNGGAGGNAGAGGTSGSGGGGGAGSIVIINEEVALIAAGGGGGAGGSGPGAQPWNGSYQANTISNGATGVYGGGCGNTDGGGSGGGGGGWQGGAAGAVDRPGGTGECRAFTGSPGASWISNAGTSTSNIYTTANGAGLITYIFTFATTTACATTSQTVDIYTVVKVTTTANCTWSVPSTVSTVDLFLVGGGGGGAGDAGPGGNGGYATSRTAVPVTPSSTMTLKVGYGGAGSAWTLTSSAYAGDSTTVVTSSGAVYSALGGQTGGNGPTVAPTTPTTPANGSFAGGKGGTAPGNVYGVAGGAGQRGVSNYFYGTLDTYAGGGGGGGFTNSTCTSFTGAAGADGGGTGSYMTGSATVVGANGTNGTGGGGGGGTAVNVCGLRLIGGKGGSGVILIRYATNATDAFPASVASSLSGRWTPNQLQVLDSARQFWIDSAGGNATAAVSGTPTIANLTGIDSGTSTGASKTNLVAAGGSNSQSTLISGTLSNYTIFHIARWPRGATTMGRAIAASGNNYVTGLYNSGAEGVAYHVNGWMTSQSYPATYKWILSTDMTKMYRANGKDISYKSDIAAVSGASGPTNFGVNNYSSEPSQWQMLDILVFNRQLSNGEIRAMEAYLARIYGLTLDPEGVTSDTDTAVTMRNSSSSWFFTSKGHGFKFNDTFTVEAWIKTDSNCESVICQIVVRENTILFGVSSGYLHFALNGGGSAGYTWTTTGIRIVPNEWHHVAMVKQFTGDKNGSLLFYLDGQLAYTHTSSPYLSSTAGNNSTSSTYALVDADDNWFYVGIRSDYSQYYQGTLDELKIWKVARTGAEILADMHSNDASNPNMQMYYNFNENSLSYADPADSTVTPLVANLAYGGIAKTDLSAYGAQTFVTVESRSTLGPYSVATFPRTIITEKGGWKVPSNVTLASAIVVGGGGGGGYGSGPAGAGGGGGVTASLVQPFTPGSTVQVQVGQGGLGGFAADAASVRNGQSSSLGVGGTLTALGGGGGGNQSSGAGAGGSSVATGGGSGGSSYTCVGSGPYSPSGSLVAGATVPSGYNGAGGIWGWGGSGGGARGAATNGDCNGAQAGVPGPGYIDPVTSIEYGRGGNATYYATTSAIAGYTTQNNGWGGITSYSSGSGNGYRGSSGTVVIRWISATKPTYTAPTNAYLNVGMTETFTTNVAQDSATATLTRTFRWESTTGGSNGTYSAIKSGTGAANASFSWVPSDTSTSGSQYLYRVVVTDSDTVGLYIVDTSTPVYAVINGTLRMSGVTSIKKQINVARNETFTISQGTPTYRFTLSPVIAGISIDTSTVGSTILKITDTATVGTFLETLTVTDSVSASVVIPLSITISAPPSLVHSSEAIANGQVFNIDFGNSNSYKVATGAISDISGAKHPVAINGGATFTTDNSGGLSMTSTPAQTLTATGFKQMNAWTIDTYIRLDAEPAAASCILTSEHTGTNIGFALCLDVGRTIFTGYFSSLWTYKRSNEQLPVGSWSHVLGTYDGTSISLWINGVAITVKDSDNRGGANPPIPDTDRVFINKEFGTNTAAGSSMTIGYARVYNVGFTYADMMRNYNAAKDRFAPANLTQLKPVQKYGVLNLESFTVTAGGDTKTITFAVGDRAGIKWDTATAGLVKLSAQESLTPGTYYDTITVTDNFAQSTILPIKFTVNKADTLTVYIDTPTALNYTGNRAIFNTVTKMIGAVGLESGTALSVTTKFKPAGTTCSTGGYCRVGDIGPGGGIVFIDTSTVSSDGRIYEVAPQNWAGEDIATVSTYCSNNNSNIGSTQVGIGWGDTNTALARTACLGGAVATVNNFNQSNSTGYSDWFIPSKNEAAELVKIPAAAGLLNIGNSWTVGNWGYWTSTELSASTMASIGHSGATFNATATVNKSEAVKNMVRPVRAFRSCWAIDTCTAIATTETPTVAGTYVITPSNALNASDLVARYTNVIYAEQRLTINKINQAPQLSTIFNAGFPETMTLYMTGGSGNGAITYSYLGAGTASGCATDYKKVYSTTIGTCNIQVYRAGDRNYNPDTATAFVYFMNFVVSQPAPATGSGPTIAISGVTSLTLDPNQAPTISSLSTYTATAGVTSIIINGAGFDHNNLAGITVKFWRNQVASGLTVNSGDSQITVTVPAGATTGKVTVTTPNGIAVSELPLTVTTP